MAAILLCGAVSFVPALQSAAQDGVAVTRPIDDTAAVDAEILALGSRSPAERTAAASALRARGGTGVRAALAVAARSGNAAIASAAQALLIELPWFEPGDPPELRAALLAYGTADDADREQLIVNLLQAQTPAAYRVLMRFVEQDPRDAVAWRVSEALQNTVSRDAALGTLVRSSKSDRASALVLRAQALFRDDQAAAVRLVREALEQERQFRTATPDQLDWPFDLLIVEAAARADYDALATIYRLQAQLAPGDGRPAADLFALHARFGPLRGFADDLKTYVAGPPDSRVLFALAALCQKRFATLPARLLRDAAHDLAVAGPDPHQAHYASGTFLGTNGWPVEARGELLACLAAARPENNRNVTNAYLRLSECALDLGDNDAASEYLENGLNQNEAVGLRRKTADGRWEALDANELRARVQWSRLKTARRLGDAAALIKTAETIVMLRPIDTALFLDIQPDLEAAGKHGIAQKLFDAQYNYYANQLAETPDDSRLLNELAWLCARSGLKPEEALSLARRAVARAPQEPTYLDTLGEALFRNDLFAEAVAVEKKALSLKPDDAFMKQQVAKFEKAADVLKK